MSTKIHGIFSFIQRIYAPAADIPGAAKKENNTCFPSISDLSNCLKNTVIAKPVRTLAVAIS